DRMSPPSPARNPPPLRVALLRRRLRDPRTHRRYRADVARALALRALVRLDVPARARAPEGTASGAAAGGACLPPLHHYGSLPGVIDVAHFAPAAEGERATSRRPFSCAPTNVDRTR